MFVVPRKAPEITVPAPIGLFVTSECATMRRNHRGDQRGADRRIYGLPKLRCRQIGARKGHALNADLPPQGRSTHGFNGTSTKYPLIVNANVALPVLLVRSASALMEVPASA
jgi:hypothetical protein